MTKARENSDYTGLAADLAGLQTNITAGDTAAKAGRKNLIINGAMQVSQRGDYTTAISSWTNGAYLMDRLLSYVSGVTATFQDMSGSVKYTATSTTSGYLGTEQRIEDYARLANKVITISAEVKSNSSSARLMIYNTAYIDGTTHTGGGGWETLTATITLSGLTRLWYQVWIASSAGGSVSITSGDYIEVRNIQLEEGSVATDFEHRSYGEELRLCERYFRTIGVGISGTGQDTTKVIFSYEHPVMRANPTLTMITSASFRISDDYAQDHAYTSGYSLDYAQTTVLGGRIKVQGMSGLQNGERMSILPTSNPVGMFHLSAEL